MADTVPAGHAYTLPSVKTAYREPVRDLSAEAAQIADAVSNRPLVSPAAAQPCRVARDARFENTCHKNVSHAARRLMFRHLVFQTGNILP